MILVFLLGQAGLMIPQVPTVFRSVSLFLMVMEVKVLVAFYRVSSHFVWPFEEWFVLNLL